MRGIIYDSGAGGLASLARLARARVAERLEYYAGIEHMPYGEKSAAELDEFVNADVARLLATGADFVLIACNTACSALQAAHVANSRVIKISDLTAALAARAPSNTLLLCTRATLASGIYKAPKDGYIAALPELVMAAERAEFSKAASIIEQIRKDFASVQQIIAGCTHYGLLGPEFAQAGFKLLDPVDDLLEKFSAKERVKHCEIEFFQPQMQEYYKEHQCRL